MDDYKQVPTRSIVKIIKEQMERIDLILAKGSVKLNAKPDKIYSSIAGGYVDPVTGEVTKEEK